MHKSLRNLTASLLMVSTSVFSVAAAASTIAPESVQSTLASAAASDQQRAQVVSWMQRADVRAEMGKLGVSSDQAVARVAALSDDEVARLSGKIDQAQVAGDGGGIIGAIVFVFIVLLVTDILGFTKIFPFTRSIR